MKSVSIVLLLALVGAFTTLSAAEKIVTDPKAAKPRPYVLKMCLVSDEKLDPGDPTFVYQGREIKVCCEGCVKDFQKEPVKYLKLIEAAEQKLAAEKAKPPVK